MYKERGIAFDFGFPVLRIMAQFHLNNDDLQYVVDDYFDDFDFGDDPFAEVEAPRSNTFEFNDSDVEDDFESVWYLISM